MRPDPAGAASGPLSPPRWARAGLITLVVLDLALRLAVIARPFAIIDGLTLPDDTYLSLTIARNIAHGLGPLYGQSYTNGFQPLYVFLMAPAFWIWRTDPIAPVRCALVLLSIFDAATLWLLYRWIWRRTGSAGAALLTGLAWAFSSWVLSTTLNGLETAIAACFLVASLSAFDALRSRLPAGPGDRRLRTLGLLLGLAIFARIDGLLLAAAVGLGLMAVLHQAGWRPWAIGRACLRVGFAGAVVNLPWARYSLHYTGHLFPVSGRAVRFQTLAQVDHRPTFRNFYAKQLVEAGTRLWEASWPLLVVIAVVALAAWALRPPDRVTSRGRPALAIVLGGYATTFLLSAALYAKNDWEAASHFYPLMVLLVAVAGHLAAGVLRDTESRTTGFKTTLLPLAALVITAGLIAWPSLRSLILGTVIIAGLLSWAMSPSRRTETPSRSLLTLVLTGYAVALVAAYTLFIFGYWFFGRYLYPLIIPLLVLLGEVTADALRETARRSPRLPVFALTAASLAIAAGLSAVPEFRTLFTSTDTKTKGYLNIALWAQEHFPAGTVVGGAQSGALGYFATKLRVVNLDGVVNEQCLRSLEQHENLKYLRSAGVQYVINWGSHTRFLMDHSRNMTAADLPLLGPVPGFTAWGRKWLLYEVRP